MKFDPPKTMRWSVLLLALWLSSAAAAQTLAGLGGFGGKARKTQTRVVDAKPDNRPEKKIRQEPAKLPELGRPQPNLKQLFTEQERSLAGLSAGNPVAQLLVWRELNRRFPITDKQRAALLTLYKEEVPPLRALREKRGRQERAVEEAIYGESFDPPSVEQLVNESAETQKELMTRQARLESRVLGIFAADNPRQARVFLLLYEHLAGPQRNNVPIAMLVNRQYNGQWRALADLFGDDMEMLIPSFGNPLAVLLVLRQLELTPEQKAEFKTLAAGIRAQMQAEFEQRAKALRELPAREQPREQPAERGGQLAERLENMQKTVEEAADRQGRLMKRQAHIETRIRQILRPKQWDDYTALLRGMLAGNLARPALPPMQQPGLQNLRQQGRPLLKRPAPLDQ